MNFNEILFLCQGDDVSDADIVLYHEVVCEHCGCENYLINGEVMPCDRCDCLVAAPA
jgi:hypothetical protein